MTKVKLDSVMVDVNDSDVNALTNLVDSKTNRIAQLEKQLADAKVELEKEKKEKEEISDEIEEEKKKSCDEAINKLVNDKATIMAKCVSMDAEFKTDKIHSASIKREFLKVKDNSIDWSKKSDDYIEGVFDSLKVEDKPTTTNTIDNDSLTSDIGKVFDLKNIETSDSNNTKGQDTGFFNKVESN